jgi:peroxiredoxin Q/BCP
LRQDYQQFIDRNAQVVVVSPEDASAVSRTWQKEQFPFVALPDPDHHVADTYGQQVKLLKLGRLPGLMVIDADGYVRYRHYGSSMRDIPQNQEILDLLEALNQQDS